LPTVISDISVMTETTDTTKTPPAAAAPGQTLPPAVERFVLQWGDMGGKWGVNRSVSQIHALLYLSDRPMSAEEVADTLWLARSNVSNSIKELLAWNLIRRVPIKGERRDHFEAETDVWEIFTRIAAGRKEREIDPAVTALKSCVADAQTDPSVNAVATARLKSMLEFVETMDRWSSEMLSVPRPKLASLLRLGARIVSLLPLGRAK
jgi:DNA-binding transcriptional regulator GbsR (MarR family)